MISTSSYPHMKKEDQEDFHKAIHKQAYPKTYENGPIAPMDLAKKLGLGKVRGKGNDG